jgi:ribosome biogenesis GTPase A
VCDCPGLVFPSSVGREELVISGVLSIAQEGKVVDVIDVLTRLRGEGWLRSELGLGESDGSGADGVCREFAVKKGFKSRGGREDLHRAGINLHIYNR